MSQSEPAPQITTDVGTALGRIASGLFVISWREESFDRAMLASWVMQAAFDPPAVSVALAKSRGLAAAVARDCPFVVNVLGETQRGLVGRFGKPAAPGDDPFSGLEVIRTPHGVAALATATAWLECLPAAPLVEWSGDHAILLGRVTAAAAAADSPPLVHLRRNGLRY